MSLELYHTMLLIAGGVNLLIALVLLVGNYDYSDYDIYRRSRRFVALCYVVFAIGFFIHAHYAWRITWPTGATALSISYFHAGAVLFGWSHISLMRPDYLTKRIIARDLIILLLGIAAYWTLLAPSGLQSIDAIETIKAAIAKSVFFLHAGFIAFTFYRTYYLVRRSLLSMPADDAAPGWWTSEAKREVLSGHHSFVICCHLIILFGIGSIVITVATPTLVWPFTVLTTVGIAVFIYIFYSLTEYGRVIESATCATEDAEKSR